MKIEAVDPKIVIITETVTSHAGRYSWEPPCTFTLTLRLDGREPGGWHVDMCDVILWESILPEGSFGPRPKTKQEAMDFARVYIQAAREQGTRHPKLTSHVL